MAQKNTQKFYETANNIATSLKTRFSEKTQVKINTHTDPDGISAGNIFARTLTSYDLPYHLSFGNPPTKEDLEEMEKEDYDLYVFLDQGTGQFEIIEKHLLEKDQEVLILDHHPGKIRDQPGLLHLNPHRFQLSGTHDVSASGVTYSVIREINKKFQPFSELALIGALGDRQDKPSEFKSINKNIQEEALEEGIITTKTGLKLDGRSLPLIDCISRSIRPFLLGLSGNKEKTREIIKDTDLNPETTIEELETKEEKKLRDKILEKTKTDSPKNLKTSLWGTIYTTQTNQTEGPKNLHEYVTLLDACEKLDKIEIGFGAMLGDKESGKKALEKLREYQKQITDMVNWITKKKERIKTIKHVRHIDMENKIKSEMVGELLSIMLESGIIKTDLPILGLAKSNEDTLKISARAMPQQTGKKPDLGEVMNKVSKDLGGRGGGHDVAAAARIPLERKNEFITKVDKFIENNF